MAEFRTVADRASYFIPTVGIALLFGIGGATLAMLIGMAAAGRGIDPPGTAMLAGWLVISVAGGAAWWVHRRWRIHHQRKLIVDERGITYVKFSGRERLMRWEDINGITEDEEWELGRWLAVWHQSGRFVIRDHAFHGYNEIRVLAQTYLPGRTRLKPG